MNVTKPLIILVLAIIAFVVPACKKEKLPDSMTITDIWVDNFVGSSSAWDLASNPDVYVQILDENSNVLYESPNYFGDVSGTQPLHFTPTSSINIICPYCKHSLRLYDYDDFDADDLMYSINFYPYNEGSNEKNVSSQSVSFTSDDADFSFSFNYFY